MRNFWNLTKIYFINLISSTQITSKRKGKFITTLFLLLGLFALVSFSLGFQYFETAKTLSEYNLTHLIFFSAGLTTFLILVMMITFEGVGHIFKTKDYESLSVLPIKPIYVVMAKIVSVFLSAYLYMGLLFLPVVVVYFIFAPITIVGLLTVILGIILLPAIPTCLSLFIGLLIAFISNKSKVSNLLSLIGNFLFVIALLGCMLAVNKYLASATSESFQIGESILLKCLLPSVTLFMTGCIQLNLIDLLIYVLVNLGIIALTIFVIVKLYEPVNKKLMNRKFLTASCNYHYEKSSQFETLLKHEKDTFFSNPMYIFNSCFGLVFMIIIPFLIKFNVIGLVLGAEIDASKMILFFSIICSSMMAGMTITSNSSISLEGKNFYILKSIPISFKKIASAKILFNILVGLPFILFTGALYIYFFKEAYMESSLNKTAYVLLTFALPLISIITFSVWGFLSNLFYPKMKYSNIMQVVKQSAAVFISLMPAMFIHMALIIFYLRMTTLTIIDFALIMLLIYGLLLTISIIILRHNGKKLFNRIN